MCAAFKSAAFKSQLRVYRTKAELLRAGVRCLLGAGVQPRNAVPPMTSMQNMQFPGKNFNFVPASTRIALSRLGHESWVPTPRGLRCLPAKQIAGEVEWHIDLMRWHAKEIAGRAFLLPESHLEAFYKAAYAELRSGSEFTTAEATAVVGLAKGVGSTLHVNAFSRVDWAQFQDELAEDWRRLGERLARFVARENTA